MRNGGISLNTGDTTSPKGADLLAIRATGIQLSNDGFRFWGLNSNRTKTYAKCISGSAKVRRTMKLIVPHKSCMHSCGSFRRQLAVDLDEIGFIANDSVMIEGLL